MSIVDDIEAVLDAATVTIPAHIRDRIIVEAAGEEDAIVRYDRPRDGLGMSIIGQVVPRELEDSRFRFRVRREGRLRTIPGPGPRASTGERASNKRAYEQRDREEPSLRVSYPDAGTRSPECRSY